MHPALHSWRDDLSATFVRLLAYLGLAAVMSMAATLYFQPPAALDPAPALARPQWIEVERPFPAFALSIPEAADVPTGYAIRRHSQGGGRKDILTLGEPDGLAPFLTVEIYRRGAEAAAFQAAADEIAAEAAALEPVQLETSPEPLDSKFGRLTILTFDTAKSPARRCLAFVRAYDDPPLQLSGWFCQGGELVDRTTLACALDRLTLLSAGSEPRIGGLFAQAELNRSYCGQRDTILAPTPKYHLLWKALATRPEPRRIGR